MKQSAQKAPMKELINSAIVLTAQTSLAAARRRRGALVSAALQLRLQSH